MDFAGLVGSGRSIFRLAAPFVVIGLIANVARPAWFSVGGPPSALAAVSVVVLAAGVVIWAWAVALILARVPRRELITTGPFALMKHPLYAGVPLLVFPWLGFLLDSWLGLALGIVFYVGARRYAPEEERALAQTFGTAWDDYCHRVMLPWL